ncbi:unnamed protein product, partial [Adineta steineri]
IANKPLNIISSDEDAQHERKLHGLADCVKNPNRLIVFSSNIKRMKSRVSYFILFYFN